MRRLKKLPVDYCSSPKKNWALRRPLQKKFSYLAGQREIVCFGGVKKEEKKRIVGAIGRREEGGEKGRGSREGGRKGEERKKGTKG